MIDLLICFSEQCCLSAYEQVVVAEQVYNSWNATVDREFYLIGGGHISLSELSGESCLPIL